MGIRSTKEELKEVNECRTGNEWKFNLSRTEANYIYRSTKKKKMRDVLTLANIFDIGVNLEGFWNYDQMDLQVEDIFDVLLTKNVKVVEEIDEKNLSEYSLKGKMKYKDENGAVKLVLPQVRGEKKQKKTV